MIYNIKKNLFRLEQEAWQRRNHIVNDLYYAKPAMEVTTRVGCAVACRSCPQELFVNKYTEGAKGGRNLSVMPFAVFKACVDKLPKQCRIVFSGMSEPFLNPECTKMILYADRRGYTMDLYTTLSGADKECFNKIKDIPFGNVVLHLPDNRKSAGIKITKEYLNVLDLFLGARKKDGKKLVTGISCHSYPDKEVAGHLKKYGLKKRKPDDMVDRAGNLSKDKGLNAACHKQPFFCTRSRDFNHNVLLPDGRVLLCCMDYAMQHVLGNLLEDSYGGIMAQKERKRIIGSCMEETGRDVLCKHCTACAAFRDVRIMEAAKKILFS